jgi:molybdopterin-synthase adenylyltransferase
MLSDLQIERYSRQIILPQVGGKGQERLLQARVLVSGNGIWQAQALLYLVAAGIGRIGIWGTASPLPILTALTAEPQASAVFALQQLNPDCAVVVHGQQPQGDLANATQLVQQYDVVIAEPNVQLHAACYTACRPFICGQILTTSAWFAVYRGYEEGLPCFACESQPEAETGLSSAGDWPIGSFLGTVIATEGIKHILGLALTGPILLRQYTFPQLSFSERPLVKNANCIVCRRL